MAPNDTKLGGDHGAELNLEEALSDKRLDIDVEESDVDSDICGSDFLSSKEEKQEDELTIARAETRAVRSFKVLVLLVLVLSAVAVALAVYFYTSNSEQQQFEVAFQDSTQKVLDSIGKAIERSMGAIDTFANGLVTYAQASNQTWPFVTFPAFAVNAEKARSLSAGVIISMHPLVTPENRRLWEAYAWEHKGWLNESMKVQETDPNYYGVINYNHHLTYPIHHDLFDVPYNSTRLMAPSWQNSPVETQTRSGSFGWDLLSQTYPEQTLTAIASKKPVITEAYNLPNRSNIEEVEEADAWAEWFRNYVEPGDDPSAPASDLQWPVLSREMDTVEVVYDGATKAESPKVVAMLMVCFFWRDMIKDILPRGNTGIVLVFRNPCNPTFTYQIDGPNVTYLGRGDFHESKYDHMEVTSMLKDLKSYSISHSKYTGLPLNDEYCPFTFSVYPGSYMEAQYTTNNPIYFTVGAVLIFFFTSAVFLLYDWMVERRQKKVMTTAVRTNAIISSLFPSVVRDRILPTETKGSEKKTVFKLANSRSRLKKFLNDGTSCHSDETEIPGPVQPTSAPIAELFPDATVLFADIAGFTAWSSIREPAQVFTLLETIYSAFDSIARKRGVFKVETIGDSYVSVCGLPEPREDHALVMARFARDCRDKMNELTRKLETSLGPDTGDLKLRFGLNSGPVTAGVLRGERSRFQLFGDTVNCAARMESNGVPNKIQASQKTADLLRNAGKGHWLEEREDLVDAKGKGKLQTYWVNPPSRPMSTGTASESTASEVDVLHVLGVTQVPGDAPGSRLERLIDWNVDAFTGLLKRMVARRMTLDSSKRAKSSGAIATDPFKHCKKPRMEVSEVIVLPEFEFCVKTSGCTEFPEVSLSDTVLWQLRDLVSVIAYMYRSNPFHNFEHASHVAMSIMKLLQRVMSPEVSLNRTCKNEREAAEALASNLHYSTYGITSDPLTQFAIVFAALIHDVDHPGVSNGQLVAEHDPMAQLYDNQSVAEQNSVSIAWELLLRDDYKDLRECLFTDASDLKRFRQLVVNSVMATDVFDKDLKAMRESRWDKAFHGTETMNTNTSDSTDLMFHRKATIVIEYLIQASDVAHTMQHWTIYQKWNRRLFDEVYAAFRSGRSPSNPADSWYKGELWFFDNYIIPLARKLKECRVFGVSCDEFLDYAIDNRSEWEAKGHAIVQELLDEAELKYGSHSDPETIIRRSHAQRTEAEKQQEQPKEQPRQETHYPGSDPEARTTGTASAGVALSVEAESSKKDTVNDEPAHVSLGEICQTTSSKGTNQRGSKQRGASLRSQNQGEDRVREAEESIRVECLTRFM